MANDLPTLALSLEPGCRATNVTSRYEGTALIESVVLGNGGARHTATLKALVDAGADVNLADRGGTTPLELGLRRNHLDMAAILERAGGC